MMKLAGVTRRFFGFTVQNFSFSFAKNVLLHSITFNVFCEPLKCKTWPG